MMRKAIYALFLVCTACYTVSAQSDYLAGGIQVTQFEEPLQDLTLEVRAELLSPIESNAEDSISVVWGDGTGGWLYLAQDTLVTPEIISRQYINNHTYPARATYSIVSSVCCFSAMIDNINPGATMTLNTTYTILNPQFQGYNTSVRASELAATGSVDEPFVFSLNAFDNENDSISVSILEIQPPNMGYQPMNEADTGGDGTLTVVSSFSGETLWSSPSVADRYYIVPYRIEDFRNGQLASTSLAYYAIHVATPTNITLPVKSDLTIFPNPANNTLQVQTNAPVQWSGAFYNAQGQLIQQWDKLPADGQLHLSCPAGIYFLQLQNGDQVFTERIVVR
ncbi:MAG: T9SS type A sorting domain-containing protein [Phaeodactylibacter sp.]|nr:T9SS type A sorting domain-containing protein [Phaeodactylibacter sp.]